MENSTSGGLKAAGSRKVRFAGGTVEVENRRLPAQVRGLKGIMELFDVSIATAWKYKNTILKGAVTQNGRVIVVDVAEALRLFEESAAGKGGES